jgi:hypothetical protein
MSKNKAVTRFGAGAIAAATIIAGLSFGPAAAQAAENAPSSASARDARLQIAQNVTPVLKSGESGRASIALKNVTGERTGDGVEGIFRAPTGTTIANSRIRVSWADGKSEFFHTGSLSPDRKSLTFAAYPFSVAPGDTVTIEPTLLADADLKQTGTVRDGALEITGGSAVPAQSVPLGYTVGGVTVTQSSLPTLKAGETGAFEVRFNNAGSRTGERFVAKITAPSGTTFASSVVGAASSTPWTGTFTGSLSSDRTEMTLDVPSAYLPENGWHTVRPSLKADADLSQAGTVRDGAFEITGGSMAKAQKIAIGYVVGGVATTQTESPTLEEGQTGAVTVKLHNIGSQTTAGTNVVFTAPSGTTFDSQFIQATSSTPWSGQFTGLLSNDRKTLSVSVPTLFLPKDGDHTLSVTLKADAPLQEEGKVSDGSFRVIGGAALPRQDFAFHYTAKKSAINLPFALVSPESGTEAKGKTVKFTGNGTPGATIRLHVTNFASSDVTGVVGEDGHFSIDRYLGTGEYRFDVTQEIAGEVTGAARGVVLNEVTAVNKPFVVESPENGATHKGELVTFTGTGRAGETVTIKVTNFGSADVATTVKNDGTWSLQRYIGTGAYAIDVIQTKNGVETGKVANLLLNQSKNPIDKPFELTGGPADGSSMKAGLATFTGTGTHGATITLAPAGNNQGAVSTTVKDDGTWSVTKWIGESTYVFTITQTSNGNTETLPKTLTVTGTK